MANQDQGHEGASSQELLVEACRRNNTDLLTQVLADKTDAQITRLLNSTTTVMGNYLYHEAASRGNYEIIDLLLDQPDFECDPVNRLEGDTPLHSAIRWLNAELSSTSSQSQSQSQSQQQQQQQQHQQREFATALITMMLEAGSDPRRRNRGGLTPYQLVDPTNTQIRHLLQSHLYVSQNAGDFVQSTTTTTSVSLAAPTTAAPPPPPGQAPPPPLPAAVAPGDHRRFPVNDDDDFDDDAEFSGSDEEERAEWETRKRERAQR